MNTSKQDNIYILHSHEHFKARQYIHSLYSIKPRDIALQLHVSIYIYIYIYTYIYIYIYINKYISMFFGNM
jgi:hypothetical protein